MRFLLSPTAHLKITFFNFEKHVVDNSDCNSYLSLTCHLKTVFGPQSEWSRRKLLSLEKDDRQVIRRLFFKDIKACRSGNQPLFEAYSHSLPCLEDEGEVLFPEDDPRCVPADALHVNINHHQVRALLVRVVLHNLQVYHRLWGCRTLSQVSTNSCLTVWWISADELKTHKPDWVCTVLCYCYYPSTYIA